MSETAVAVSQGPQMPLLDGSPDEQIERAASMARSLQKVVEQAGLSRSFGGAKKYLEYEAWLTLGRFFQCSPVTEWTRPIEKDGEVQGYECRVNVVDAEGRVIGGAEGMCMKDEPNWKGKPDYAVRSMAQTRTAGKALRSVFGFVAVLAGYSGTPVEEMNRQWVDGQGQASKSTQRPKQGRGQARPMSEPQRKKLWAMCQEAGLSREDSKMFVESLGLQSIREASQAIENFQDLLEGWRVPVAQDVQVLEGDDIPF